MKSTPILTALDISITMAPIIESMVLISWTHLLSEPPFSFKLGLQRKP